MLYLRTLVTSGMIALITVFCLAQGNNRISASGRLNDLGFENLPNGNTVVVALGEGVGPNSEYNFDNEKWGSVIVYVFSDGLVSIEVDEEIDVIGTVSDSSLSRKFKGYRGEKEPEAERYNRIANIVFDSTHSAHDLVTIRGALKRAGFWRIRLLAQDDKGARFIVPFNSPGRVEVEYRHPKRIDQPKKPKDKLPSPRRNIRSEAPPDIDDLPENPIKQPEDEKKEPDKSKKKDKDKDEEEGPEIEPGAFPIEIWGFSAKNKAGEKTVLYVISCDEKQSEEEVNVPDDVDVLDPFFLAGTTNIGYGGVGEKGLKVVLKKLKAWTTELKSNEVFVTVPEAMKLKEFLKIMAAVYDADAVLTAVGS